MSLPFSPAAAAAIAAEIRLAPQGQSFRPIPPEKKFDVGYVVVGEGHDGCLADCVTVRVWEGATCTVWLHVSDCRSKTWSAMGAARGGGYNRSVAAVEEAVKALSGALVDFTRPGGSVDRMPDGLAALAIAAGFTPRLVIRV